ncbi:MAG: hypothetical protein CVT95_10560 [Bacteroidetes bacterium HGW-Bacteroidetes-12]|nr:MAG: hypothetical protein CVT95_10560 [Bacteroidetes bacterium HGW-Bacteroidetes-12]
MRKKKDLPLVILKALEPYVGLKGDKFEVIEPKENLLKVIDKDIDSDFHFTIEKYQQTNNGGFQFLMTRSPKNVNDNGLYQTWVEISGLGGQFDAWLKLLNEYETVNSFFDDPIAKSFRDEFFAEFEIIDEDAEINPLNTKQILLLDSYLDSVDAKLSEFTSGKNSQDIQDIKEDILQLKDNLTKKSKKWVISKLTNIWAKIAKQGTKFIKEFLSESKKELIKQGVKGIIDFAKENGQDLLN